MKLLTEEQFREHQAASLRGSIEGAVGGAALAGAASLYARRFPGFRNLPPSLKVLGGIIIIAPLVAIQGERRGLEYDRSQWEKLGREAEGLRIMDQKELAEMKRWESLSLSEKIADWASRHQYTLIMGGWAGSLGIAAAIISRNKYQTYPQKIVQARMWAQGLTIGLLIVAGALTHKSRAEQAVKHVTDHSWKDVLDQQERDRQLEEADLAKSRGSITAP
ncbi:hypothetical protein DFP72DRAFT_877829 [Ephemerocybe angulata]|uniref:HIG1 domain-containing protein n=1 Tax=Ephemerocybe angulata TaxID=980116 RepID=A0A8H6MDN1_9AGAR|nr:hypothetical protein DFP72DRAFT_877829 [Tulosesus angulatus]